MNQLIEKLIASGTVVTDGSWGTQMQRRGLARGECPDSWNLNHPERVEEVAIPMYRQRAGCRSAPRSRPAQ